MPPSSSASSSFENFVSLLPCCVLGLICAWSCLSSPRSCPTYSVRKNPGSCFPSSCSPPLPPSSRSCCGIVAGKSVASSACSASGLGPCVTIRGAPDCTCPPVIAYPALPLDPAPRGWYGFELRVSFISCPPFYLMRLPSTW